MSLVPVEPKLNSGTATMFRRGGHGASALFQSVSVSLVSLFVSACGVGNNLILAHTFGATSGLDGYFYLSSLPMFVLGILNGALGQYMVPLLAKRAQVDDFRSFVARLALQLLGCVAIISSIGIGLSELLFYASPLFIQDALARQSWTLIVANWIAVIFAPMNMYLSAVYQQQFRFTYTVSLSALPYIFCSGLCLSFGEVQSVWVIGVGLALGHIAQSIFLILRLPLDRPKVTTAMSKETKVAAIKSLQGLVVAIPSALSYNAPVLIDPLWGAALDRGAVTYLSFCLRLTVGLVGFIATGISTVISAHIPIVALRNDREQVLRQASQALVTMFATATPIAVGFYLVRYPLLSLLLAHGAFRASDASMIAHLIPIPLAGMIAMACSVVLLRCLNANYQKTDAWVLSTAFIATYFVSVGLALKAGLVGILIAQFCCWWMFLAALVWRFFKAEWRALLTSHLDTVGRITLATLVSAVIVGSGPAANSHNSVTAIRSIGQSLSLYFVIGGCLIAVLFWGSGRSILTRLGIASLSRRTES